MYADNTLTPKEAIRLCVLGTLALATSPMPYDALASAVRHFIDRILGPSIELMGPSVELLKYEGLIAAVESKGMEDNATFTLTEDGNAALDKLLIAPLRNQATDLNKLIVALKFRFLHLLNAAEGRHQADYLVEYYEGQLVRLDDLRQFHADDPGHLAQWLSHDLALTEQRLVWLKDFQKSLDAA